jgi:hypothetical protein
MIRQEPLRTQFGVLFGWFKRNFSLKTPTVVEKFHPKSWKVHIPGDFCSKSRKIRKIRKVEKSKSSKNSKSRKLFDFLTFCEKFCNFRAVRLPARRALSKLECHTYSGQLHCATWRDLSPGERGVSHLSRAGIRWGKKSNMLMGVQHAGWWMSEAKEVRCPVGMPASSNPVWAMSSLV